MDIIITTHQGRKDRCKKAIQSVIDQTYKDWNLIVVNDGAKDGTNEMVRAFKDSRISLIVRKKCFGTDTRPKNEGILACKSDWISFLDSDNVWLGDHLMILNKEHEKRPEADVIYGDRLTVNEDDSFDMKLGINADFNIVQLFERNFIDISDVLVRKSTLFEVGGFDERYKKFVDWNLWIRLAKAGKKFDHIGKVITEYHLHKDTKSLKNKEGYIGTRPIGKGAFEPLFRPKWDAFELEIYSTSLTGEKWKPKVAIWTLTYNRLELTKIMYESLKKAGYPFDWYVVDQGSTDGTVEWLKKVKPHKVIFNEKNRGISIGSNQAVEMIKDYDFSIKIDNDCEILSDNWLVKMLEIFASHYMICLSPRVEGLIDNPGGMPRIAYRKLMGHTIGITSHIGGIFTMAHSMAYEGFRWDEDDFLHALQDMMFTQAMNDKGFLVGYVEDLRCIHQMTTEGQRKAFPEYFKRRELERTQTYEK